MARYSVAKVSATLSLDPVGQRSAHVKEGCATKGVWNGYRKRNGKGVSVGINMDEGGKREDETYQAIF